MCFPQKELFQFRLNLKHPSCFPKILFPLSLQKKHMEQEVIEELIPLPQLLSRTYQKVDVHGQRAGR